MHRRSRVVTGSTGPRSGDASPVDRRVRSPVIQPARNCVINPLSNNQFEDAGPIHGGEAVAELKLDGTSDTTFSDIYADPRR